VHVPLLFVAPGLLADQVRVTRVASLVDLAPTILDLLGIESPSEYQGQSLLPNRRPMALFFTDYSLALAGLRDDHWKFVDDFSADRFQLFDVARDPMERTNLAARIPKRAAVYHQLLVDWSSAQKSRVLAVTRKGGQKATL
jgi:arylsulfatase A-like enzyme